MELFKSRWFIFFCLLASVFVLIEAAAFQVPAMPYIVKSFGLDSSLAGLISLLYYIAAISFFPVMGKISDMIGRRKLILFGLFIFALSEIGAAFAPNYAFFLTMRFVQGLGYATVYPTVYATIADLFKDEERGKAIGILATAASLGAASGGVIAGVMISQLGWQSIYWVSGAFAFLGFIIVTFILPKGETKPIENLDIKGTGALLLSIASFISLPTLISQFGVTSIYVFIAIVLSVAGISLLIIIERKAKEPAIDVKVFSLKSVYLSGAVILLTNFISICVVYTLSFYLSGRSEFTPVEVGLISTVSYTFTSLAAFTVGILVDKFKPVLFVIIGCTFILTGVISLSFIEAKSSLFFILFCVALVGFGNGGKNPALVKLILRDVPGNLKGAGSGAYLFFSNIGIPFGSTIGLALFSAFQKGSTSADPVIKATHAIAGMSWILLIAILVAICAAFFLSRSQKKKLEELQPSVE